VPSTKRIGLIDYGSGNFGSVRQALLSLGLDVVELRTGQQFAEMGPVILPGVGAFAATMDKLDSSGLSDAIREHALQRQRPVLGICVGLQVMAEAGEEFETRRGLGLLPGTVARLPSGARVPHMGWSEVSATRQCPLLEGLGPSPAFYFAHSYSLRTTDEGIALGLCDYAGGVIAIAGRSNIMGVQFHPEKSQADGLALLKNFAEMN
jgi:glutamine amidotransferase